MACRGEVRTNTDIDDYSLLNDNRGVWVCCVIVGIHWSAPIMWVVLITAAGSSHLLELSLTMQPCLSSCSEESRPVPARDRRQRESPLCLDSVTGHWVIPCWHQVPRFTSATSRFRASSASAWKDPSKGPRVNPNWTGISVSVCPLPTAPRTGKVWCGLRTDTQHGRRARQGIYCPAGRLGGCGAASGVLEVQCAMYC